MYVPEGKIGYRVYWEDMTGNENEIFASGFNNEDVLISVIDYIRNNLYMASFTIVGMEQRINNSWEPIDCKRQWCEGR